jgi:hypothetical protein
MRKRVFASATAAYCEDAGRAELLEERAALAGVDDEEQVLKAPRGLHVFESVGLRGKEAEKGKEGGNEKLGKI